MSHTTIIRFIDGENVDFDTQLKICKWLGVDYADFVNVEQGSDDTSIAAKITTLLSQKPRFKEVFAKILDDYEQGILEKTDVEDILGYIAFRIKIR